jgi:hypothetical protein
MYNHAVESSGEDFFIESHRRIFDQMMRLSETGGSRSISIEGLRQAAILNQSAGWRTSRSFIPTSRDCQRRRLRAIVRTNLFSGG